MDEAVSKQLKFGTLAVHAGQAPAPGNNAIMTPVYLSTTFVQQSPGVYAGYDYGRTGNPTRTALELNLAALEDAAHCSCFSSGCAAADAVLHLFEQGGHIVCSDDVYGGTFRLFDKVFRRHGLTFDYVDLTDVSRLPSAIRAETKLIWLETPTNPLLKIIDIRRVAEAAQAVGVKLLVDNTFASPYIQQPLRLGADLVLHSSTKYLGGHSDVIGGAVLTNDAELGERIAFLQNAVGAVPSPFDCFLLLRSTKTLPLRMEAHSKNAAAVAEFLRGRADVARVIYPGLSSHPQYPVGRKQMRLGGGMITFELQGGLERSKDFLQRLQIFSLAESLGGVESLAEHPALMTHASIPMETRKALGITDGLVRLSVGIEDSADLIADLEQALEE